MKISKQSLYFVGHRGLIQRLDAGQRHTMYVPDANLVLSLLRARSKGETLSGRHKHFLSVTKQAINHSWHQQKRWIPVNPVLALMELTQQHRRPNFRTYFELHQELFSKVFCIRNVAPEWVAETFLSALKAQISTLPSIARTIETVYELCSDEEKPSDSDVIESCEKLFEWMWLERERLALIGGPLIYLSIYAFAGSPQARAFIKYAKRSPTTASNVAWDMLYWIMLELDYHQPRYENTVVCTSDRALGEFLGSRTNQGPRGQVDPRGQPQYVEAYGDFSPAKLKRLENTKLEQDIFDRYLQFMCYMERVESNSIKFGFNILRET